MSVRARRFLLYVGTPLLLAAITWADFATGNEFGFFVFYFVPVALAAWYGSRRAGVVYAIAAGACWYLSDRLTHTPYSNALIVYWETFMRLVSFLTTALTLSQIRSNLRKREELLDVISHDLRAPLGALTWQAKLLPKRSGDDGFVRSRAESILRCASRMNTMIEDLLDSARKESHQLQPSIEQVRVGPYLSEMIERFDHVLEVRRIRLKLEAGDPLVARADPARLERIVLNLLMNAQKYSPPDTPIELEAHGTNGWITIRVADQGPGIPAADLPHVFDKYYRGHRTTGGGLGIGLYSVRLLVEAFGGNVRAETGTSGGTAFLVTLPGAPRRAAASPA
jgi:signal transduction histidine kinase